MAVGRVYKEALPYNASELSDIDYVQSFDVVYLAHLNHGPGKLVRAGHSNWIFSSLTMGPTIAAPTGVGVTVTNPNTDAANTGDAYFPQPANYVVTAMDDATGQESRASAPASGTNDLSLKRNKNVVAWGAVVGADRYRVYKSDNEQDYGFIGYATGLSFTDDNIDADLTDGPLEGRNPFVGGQNPSTVTFFEQRLIWARTPKHPNGVFASRSADFENMDVARPGREDDAISFTIAAQKVNSVNALVPLQDLMALTSDAVFTIKGSNTDYLAASPPPRALRQSGRGASRLKPLVIDEVTFYTPAVGSEIRSLGFTFEIDGYRSSDVSIFSPRLFRGFEINGWTYAEEPLSVVWTVRNDGKMPTFTWQLEHRVWGWTLCETDGVVEDAVAVPEGGESRVYLVVRRTVNGVERRFLERLASAKWEDVKESCYLDCAVSKYLDAPTQIISGLSHLEGERVDALADGAVVQGLTVVNGVVDLGFEATEVVTVGLPYEALIETLPLHFQSGDGAIRDKRQMLGDIVVQFVDTRVGGIETGRSEGQTYPFKARRTEALGTAPALFTGARSAATQPVTSGEATLFIRSVQPIPMTVTACFLDPIVSEN